MPFWRSAPTQIEEYILVICLIIFFIYPHSTHRLVKQQILHVVLGQQQQQQQQQQQKKIKPFNNFKK